jgi:PadR family transcriptional regulator PadR
MDTSLSKVATQMRKGVLEYAILSIIAKGEAYASDILETLKNNKLIVVEGTLYPLLSRLKTDELISYYWIESRTGPPRKYYKLTPSGQEILRVMDLTWKELSTAIHQITT